MSTQENTTSYIDYASFWKRFFAALLDALIISIPCAIGSHLIPVVGGLLVLFFYSPVLECSELRATLGKYLMGLQVTDVQGRRISFQASMIRNIVKVFSTGILFIGYLFALFTEKHQALHDLLAETVVVYGRSERSIVDAWSDSVKKVFGSMKADEDPLSKLERLQRLRETGAITEEEYLAQKRKILSET